MHHIRLRREPVHQASQAALQSPEQGLASLGAAACRHQRARQTALRPLHLHKPRKDAGHAELVRIAAIHARKQRLGEVIQRLAPKVIRHEFRNAAVRIGRRPAEELQAHAHLRPPTDQRRRQHRTGTRRHEHGRPLGQANQFPVALNVGDALLVVRADDVAGQAQFLDQLHRLRLGRDETIGTPFEHAVFPLTGFDHPANSRLFFDQSMGNAGVREIIGSRKTGRCRRRR